MPAVMGAVSEVPSKNLRKPRVELALLEMLMCVCMPFEV